MHVCMYVYTYICSVLQLNERILVYETKEDPYTFLVTCCYVLLQMITSFLGCLWWKKGLLKLASAWLQPSTAYLRLQ